MRFTRPIIVAIILALPACVADMYHAMPGRTPDLSVYDANRACLPFVQEAMAKDPAPITPGLLPTLTAMNTPEGQARQAAIDAVAEQCMAQHGWARN